MKSIRNFSRNLTGPHYLWMGVFSIWGFFLSGLGAGFTGAPGIIQAFHVQSLLDAKEAEQTKIESEIARLESEEERLIKNAYAQEVEIRKNLGYIGEDEIVFEFSSTTESPDKK